jgi:hypothetical protein
VKDVTTKKGSSDKRETAGECKEMEILLDRNELNLK